jgi:hypothetical protein
LSLHAEHQVKDKVFSLRSRYNKELVKVRASLRTAGAKRYTPVWKFFPLLDSFLRPFCVTRKMDSPVVRAFLKGQVGDDDGGSGGEDDDDDDDDDDDNDDDDDDDDDDNDDDYDDDNDDDDI